jgi:ribosomal protein S6
MAKEPVLYEAMYIFDVDLTDEQTAAVEDRFKAGLETQGAEVVDVQPFGRRRMAFEIKGRREGIYRIMYFKGNGAAVEELKHEFILSEEVIRGMVTVANPKMIIAPKPVAPPVEEPVAEEAVAEEAAAEPVAEEAAAEEAVVEEPVAEEAAVEPVAEEAVAEPVVEEAVVEEAVVEEPAAEEVVAAESETEAPAEPEAEKPAE